MKPSRSGRPLDCFVPRKDGNPLNLRQFEKAQTPAQGNALGSGGNALGIKQNNPIRALKGQPNDVRR
ncbi:MAG: hypothetical protein LBS88_10120 [Tannerellaceae bacterium]|nr:hypothetical protein [Tannerellaceae bacterium]